MARNFQWASPQVIDTMFCDRLDYHGLVYWYEDAVAQQEELKNNLPKPKDKER